MLENDVAIIFFAIFATFYDSGTKLVEWGRITGLARFLNRVMALTISLISLHIADHRTSALLIKMWTLMMRIDQCWCTTQITSDQIERSSDHILITKLILILSYSSSAITLKDLKRDKFREKPFHSRKIQTHWAVLASSAGRRVTPGISRVADSNSRATLARTSRDIDLWRRWKR